MTWINASLKPNQIENTDCNYSESDVTFLIAARNEENNIERCLRAIANEIGDNKATVVLIDDHSKDETIVRAKKCADQHSQLELLCLSNLEVGKKAALKTGMQHVKSKLIYLIDADCELQRGSLKQMLAAISENETSAVQGMVMYYGSNLLSRLLQIENLNNMAVTEAMLVKKIPGFGNAGNLMFKSDVQGLYSSSLDSKQASGDDVFFIQGLLESKKKIAYQRASIVKTNAPENLKMLFQQRLRWAKKGLGNKHKIGRWLPHFVFLTHLLFIGFTIYTIAIDLIYWSAIAWVLKVALELSYHRLWFSNFGVKPRLVHSILVSLCYPFYTLFIGAMAASGLKFKWKGRELSF